MNYDKIHIINKSSIEAKHRYEHKTYEYYKYEITKPNTEGQCRVAIYEIPPQKSNYPYHYHHRNEEVFYIISGKGILETPDGNFNISAGDTIICPASKNGAHRIINSSNTEMLIYFDCDTANYPDVVEYPKSEKVGILVKGQPNRFYKNSAEVGYYDGE